MKNNSIPRDQVKVSLYLDTRRKKDIGTYPVKIRVYDPSTKKAKHYSTNFDLHEKDFNRIFYPEIGQRFRAEEKEIQSNLLELEGLYKKHADSLKYFNFEAFESLFESKTGDDSNVFFHFENKVKELREAERFSTATTYYNSLQSLKLFLKYKNGKESKSLNFHEITVKLLESYEEWMNINQGKSLTTVGIYLRNLRAIFNKVIETKIIDSGIYPFGVRRYEIPASNNIKKAFTEDQLSKLFKSEPKIAEQQKAKDYWFFSYVCNGMNIKDIVYLKWGNITDEQIEFIREKTKRTKKANQIPIQVPMSAFAKDFIEKYGTKDKGTNDYVFPIINNQMNEEEKDKKRKNFTRFINQHLKNLAKDNGLNDDVSTYWARHSFATMALRNNASIELVSEALGHSDMKTTKIYFAGFENKHKKDNLDKITNFMK